MKDNEKEVDAFDDLMRKVFSYSVLTPVQEARLEEDLHWAIKAMPLTTIIPVQHICAFIETQNRLAVAFLRCSWQCRKESSSVSKESLSFKEVPFDTAMDMDCAEGNERAFDLFWQEISSASHYSLHLLDTVYQLFVRSPDHEPQMDLAAAKQRVSQFVSLIMSRARSTMPRSALVSNNNTHFISSPGTMCRIFTFLNAILAERPGFLLDLVLELESFALQFSNLQEAIALFRSLKSLQQMPLS